METFINWIPLIVLIGIAAIIFLWIIEHKYPEKKECNRPKKCSYLKNSVIEEVLNKHCVGRDVFIGGHGHEYVLKQDALNAMLDYGRQIEAKTKHEVLQEMKYGPKTQQR